MLRLKLETEGRCGGEFSVLALNIKDGNVCLDDGTNETRSEYDMKLNLAAA
jgi:hypothetical protein